MDDSLDRQRVTHPLHVGYLVSGLVFCGIAGLWGLRAADLVEVHQLGWLFPLLLVVAGALGILAMLVRSATGGGARRLDDPDDPDDRFDTDDGSDDTRVLTQDDLHHQDTTEGEQR